MSEPEQVPLAEWAPAVWSQDDTAAYLKQWPLPSDFVWPHRDGGERPVHPSHSYTRGGYGKWLRETPYFEGLFQLIHDELVRLPADAELPTPEQLAARLNELRRMKGQQVNLF
jgi:hypothetical protein